MKHIESINVVWNGERVGNLSLTSSHLCVFEYSDSFITNGVSISPFELPLKKGVFVAQPTPFEGGFGVFDDSLPDGWGLLILDRYLKKKGINPRSLNLLDRLSLVGSSGRGALEFYPDNSIYTESEYQDFQKMAIESMEILKSEDYEGEGIEELYSRGGSPGGARPKVFIKQDGLEWLVKFPALFDPINIGKIEYDYSLLAKKAGIDMPETRLFENKYFGTQRFDRKDGKKIHVVSIAGLLRADYRLPSIDYSHVFRVVAKLTNDMNEILKVYRLMVFNYLIGNKDDHAKNFSMIYDNDKWHFSPAYDILPGGGINGYRTTSINDSIDPTSKDIILAGESAGISRSQCVSTYQEIRELLTTR